MSAPSPARHGILLVNLGTPAAPTASAVRRYLAQFLADPRVVELPRWLWWLVLHGVILRIRPRRSAHGYAKIWTAEGSPLMVMSRRLAGALESALGEVPVVLAMRYGEPSIAAGLAELQRRGLRRVFVLPLYPQYAAATTASVFDAVAAAMRRTRWLPELRFLNDYHDEARYIDALADSVRAWQATHGRPDRLLLSFHGLPQRCIDKGDPYFAQCQRTAALLRERLGLDERDCVTSFQSRVGAEAWVAPYTEDILARWPGEGVRRIQVLCPGFAVDCLETLEEIALRDRGLFIGAGGETLQYIPALNDGEAQVALLADLACRHAQGWGDDAGAA